MLATSICREVHFTVLPQSNKTMNAAAAAAAAAAATTSRVSRCLFGSPNSRETADMLQEALDNERKSFTRRWGVDPCSENKENDCRWKFHEQNTKKRSSPYSKQTNIHDYWRARKAGESGKKPLTSSSDITKPQSVDRSPRRSPRSH
ncbi:uncharacterized protein LOC124431421 [Vespa crabro]|uniref:uncharacterized protein LOC124431421 n=1 Tax=Vespa crabro TaxID=7445 RepID=UPI001EFFBE38|nr:uncharacterized protein LOC124431421 [Vespa crabro]